MALSYKGLVEWSNKILDRDRPFDIPPPSQALIDFYEDRVRMSIALTSMSMDWELSDDFASCPHGYKVVNTEEK